MTKVDIVSGFLGAGKTTLIKKLVSQVYAGERLVLIENEFGEIGIDGGFLREAGIQVTEMNSGCICCTLVGDFSVALKKVLQEYHPDRVLIEPSGVGKLSDVAKAVEGIHSQADIVLGSLITVVDGKKAKMYMKNFGEFYDDQVEHATTIVLSRTQSMDGAKLDECVRLLKEKNDKATVITTPWDQLTGDSIRSALEHSASPEELIRWDEEDEHDHEGHEHHHDHEGHEHHDHEEHGHHHDHDHDHEGHEHHHHDHDHEEHEHHHDHGEGCTCGCHDHDHGHHHHGHDHHHHHADEVFTSWGVETAHRYSREELEPVLKDLAESQKYGTVLRAKGIVPAADGSWMEFDLVPMEYEIREGQPDYTGKLCVIGTDLAEADLKEAFHI